MTNLEVVIEILSKRFGLSERDIWDYYLLMEKMYPKITTFDERCKTLIKFLEWRKKNGRVYTEG